MSIIIGSYYEEITIIEGNTKQIFTNVDYIFKQVDALWVLTETGWEICSSDIFIRIETGWVNILTGSYINDELPLSSYDVVLDASAYDNLLTQEDYDEIQE